MKIKLKAEFDLKNPFEKKRLKDAIRTMFRSWGQRYNLKNIKLEFDK